MLALFNFFFVSDAGTKGKTDLISLDCHRTSKGEKTDKYSFEAMDVGEVLMINLHSDACSWFFKNPDWFVNRISVISSTEKDSFEFPCHQWVFPDVAVIQRGGNKQYIKRECFIKISKHREVAWKSEKQQTFFNFEVFVYQMSPSFEIFDIASQTDN